MIDIKVRQATPADYAALAELMTELGYAASPAEIAKRMEIINERTDYAILVAQTGGGIAGVIALTVTPSLYRSDPQGAIVALVVSSAYRGRGTAGTLVQSGENWLREHGVQRVTVNPSIPRENAHRLYARLGYEHTGLRFTKSLGA